MITFENPVGFNEAILHSVFEDSEKKLSVARCGDGIWVNVSGPRGNELICVKEEDLRTLVEKLGELRL